MFLLKWKTRALGSRMLYTTYDITLSVRARPWSKVYGTRENHDLTHARTVASYFIDAQIIVCGGAVVTRARPVCPS